MKKLLTDIHHSKKDQRGFTFVEIAIVAPIVILVIGAFITVVVSITGEVLASRASTQLLYNVQDALNQIDQDVKLSSTFLAETNITPQSPQGYSDDTTPFYNVDSTNGPMLILNTLATTGNPLSSASSIAYLSNSPNACGSLQGQNTPESFNVVYFIKNNSLWRRTIAPLNYWSSACNTNGTGTAAPWQQPSCTVVDPSNRYCETQDEDLVDGVSTTGLTIHYYNGSGGAVPENTAASALPDPTCTASGTCVSNRNAALQSATTVKVSIDANQTVGGKNVEQTASISSTRLDTTASAVAPAVSQTTPATPVVTGNYTQQTATGTFTWPGVAGGGTITYSLDYAIVVNGVAGSWISGLTNSTAHSFTIPNTYNGESINVRVIAKNTNTGATSSYGTTSFTIPTWIPATLQNSWTNYGGGYSTAAFTKTSDSLVVLRGLVDAGTTTTDTVIATLPVGYRPSAVLTFTTITSPNVASYLSVWPDGSVKIEGGSNSYLSLDGIEFLPSTSPYTFTGMSLTSPWVNYGGVYQIAGYTLDAMGRTHIEGLIKGGSTAGGSVIAPLPTSPVAYTPALYMHLPTVSNSAFGIMEISQPGNTTYPGTGIQFGSGSNVWFSLDGMFYTSALPASTNCPSAISGWCNLTLQHSWVWYSATSTFATPQYTEAADGVVTLKGLITGGTATAGTVIATLPVGYRPASRLLEEDANTNVIGRIDIDAGGNIIVEAGGNNWLSLNGINFVADQ